MTPPPIELSAQELEALIERINAHDLLEKDYETLAAMGQTIHVLSHNVDEKAASIKRLLKMIFGASTEKTAAVTKKPKRTDTTSVATPEKKGHGRNGAADFTGAEKIAVSHDGLKHKDGS